jgi:small subunit ribosomal protein S16
MVKIRLARKGRKKLAIYDIVVADAKAPRDGRFIEKIGTYNPNTKVASIDLKEDRALYWVMVGAQPTDTTRGLLSQKGVMYKKHLQVGVNKGAITQEQADAKYLAWTKSKETAAQNKLDGMAQSKETAKKAALAAETKVKEARAEAIKKKAEVVVEAPVAENTESTENTEN